MMARLLSRGLLVAMFALVVAGCDKCGHPVHLNAPSIPNACTADTTQG